MKYFNFFEDEKKLNQNNNNKNNKNNNNDFNLNEEDLIPNYTKILKVPKYLEKVNLFILYNKKK